jgi:hypothetical protein
VGVDRYLAYGWEVAEHNLGCAYGEVWERCNQGVIAMGNCGEEEER